MHSFKLSGLFATSLIALATQVSAQVVNSPAVNWSGAYVGLSVGSGSGNAHTTFTQNSNTDSTVETIGSVTRTTIVNPSSGSLSGNITGSMADLFIGYNLQPSFYPHFILGAQLEGNVFNQITLATTGQRVSSNVTTEDDGIVTAITTTQSSAPYELRDELSSMFAFLLRGGYLVNSRTLIYVLAGGVEGNFSLPNNVIFDGQNRNRWSSGYSLGGGLEYRFDDHWSLRGEYRYINFSNINRNQSTRSTTVVNPEGPNNTTNTTVTTDSSSKTGFNFNMGMIAVVYGIG